MKPIHEPWLEVRVLSALRTKPMTISGLTGDIFPSDGDEMKKIGNTKAYDMVTSAVWSLIRLGKVRKQADRPKRRPKYELDPVRREIT